MGWEGKEMKFCVTGSGISGEVWHSKSSKTIAHGKKVKMSLDSRYLVTFIMHNGSRCKVCLGISLINAEFPILRKKGNRLGQ